MDAKYIAANVCFNENQYPVILKAAEIFKEENGFSPSLSDVVAHVCYLYLKKHPLEGEPDNTPKQLSIRKNTNAPKPKVDPKSRMADALIHSHLELIVSKSPVKGTINFNEEQTTIIQKSLDSFYKQNKLVLSRKQVIALFALYFAVRYHPQIHETTLPQTIKNIIGL